MSEIISSDTTRLRVERASRSAYRARSDSKRFASPLHPSAVRGMPPSFLAALPARGAFTETEHKPTPSASDLRPYVPRGTHGDESTSKESSDSIRVRTDGTNILIRQLSQTRARAEAKRRALRAKAASEAKARTEAIAAEAKRVERERSAALERASGTREPKREDATTQGAEKGGAGANPFSRKRAASGEDAGARAGGSAKRGRGST